MIPIHVISVGQDPRRFSCPLPTYHASRHVQANQVSWWYCQTIDVSSNEPFQKRLIQSLVTQQQLGILSYIILCFTAPFKGIRFTTVVVYIAVRRYFEVFHNLFSFVSCPVAMTNLCLVSTYYDVTSSFRKEPRY